MRSATHATDSTCSGWSANSAATSHATPKRAVQRITSMPSSTDASTCKPSDTKWCAPGASPNSSTSSMCDSHVKGCQFAASPDVNAYAKAPFDNPARTTAFSVT
ncbi:MAG: hypothetical protein IPJ77_14935 [Planctomycetes bacterium]|nr:hypothetical protein [Planctomycetota bacterium]